VHELQKSGTGTEANGPQENDGEQDELATLCKDVECLQRVSGEEVAGLLQAKRRRIDELTARKRAERPAHVQLKKLEKLEKKQKFLVRQSGVISELEEKTRKAREEVTKAEGDIKDLQAQKDILLRKPIQAAAGGGASGAAKALEALQALKASMDGPGAEAYLQYLGPLEAEISKFHEMENIDIETASVAADDMDAEERAEMDRIEKMETSADGGKEKRTAMLSFTRGVVVMQAKKRSAKRKT